MAIECNNILGLAVTRGDIPIELGDSWLTGKTLKQGRLRLVLLYRVILVIMNEIGSSPLNNSG